MTLKRGNIFFKVRITQGILQLQSSPASDMKLIDVYGLVYYEINVLYRKHTCLSLIHNIYFIAILCIICNLNWSIFTGIGHYEIIILWSNKMFDVQPERYEGFSEKWIHTSAY